MMITMRPAAQSCMARGYLQARRSHDLRAQEVAGMYWSCKVHFRKSICAHPTEGRHRARLTFLLPDDEFSQ